MRRLAPWLLVTPAATLVLAGLLLPVAQTLVATLTTPRGLLAPYQRFFGSSFNQGVLLHTLEIAAGTTLLALLLGFPAAALIARRGRTARSVLIVAAVFPLLTGVVVRSFAWMVLLGRNGLVNALLLRLGLVEEPLALLYTQGAVVVGLVYLFTPLMILSLVGVLEAIETDLTEAAASLGAGPWAGFRQVVLPLATPGLIVGGVLVFTGSFAAFATPQLLGGDRQTVLATLLYQKAMVSADWVAAATIAAIMAAVTLAVVAAMGRAARAANPVGAEPVGG